MNLPHNEAKHLAERRLEEVRFENSCEVCCFLQDVIKRGLHLSVIAIQITGGYSSWITKGLACNFVYFTNTAIEIQKLKIDFSWRIEIICVFPNDVEDKFVLAIIQCIVVYGPFYVRSIRATKVRIFGQF
jgi:hypothetical protein